MASAAEQLASNLNFSAFAKAEDLKKRIWFTIGALLVYRLGTYIPLPGINPDAFAQAFSSQSKGVLGMFNMFAGGAVQRMAIFALGIMPYISASIIMQLMTSVIPSLEALKKEGEQGRKIINQYTRYGTVLLALVQAYGISVGLEGGNGIVNDPGVFFRISTVVTLVGGTMFLMWLGEQITARGIGNGISLIIFSGIVAGLPRAISGTLELGRTGALSTGLILAIIVLAIVVIALIVFFERAQRRLLIQYPKRQVGNRMFQGDTSHLPLKLNTSGVIPPIFASSLLFAAGNRRRLLADDQHAGLGKHHPGLARPWPAALHAVLCCYDRVLRLLLHRDRLQPEGHRRSAQEALRLHPRLSSGRAHRRLHRLRSHPHHRRRRCIPGAGVSVARVPDFRDWRTILPWWHIASDRGQCNARYGGADSGSPDRPSV